MKRLALSAFLFLSLLNSGCEPKVSSTNDYDCGPVFNYAGTYSSTLEGSSGGDSWEDEFDIVVQQNGPAIMLANVLAVADPAGMNIDNSYEQLDYWINGGEYQVVTYYGASRAGDPYVIDLEINVEYPNLDGWDYSYVYVISLNTALSF